MPKSKIGKFFTFVWPAGTHWLVLATPGLAPRLASAIFAAISFLQSGISHSLLLQALCYLVESTFCGFLKPSKNNSATPTQIALSAILNAGQ